MSLLRVDARFVLPAPVRRATVLAGDEGWCAGLRESGASVDPGPGSGSVPPDLVVAPALLARSALRVGAPMVLLEGRHARSYLRGSSLLVRRYVAAPSVEEPRLLISLDHRRAAAYALENWSLASTPRRRVRNRAARILLGRGMFPEVRPLVTVVTRSAEQPFLVAAAAPFGVPPDAEWFLSTVGGDPLSRGIFYLFERRADAPSWVLKFARVPGYTAPFDRDERGLRLAGEAGGVVAAHAPRLLGRLEVDGLHASLESAAVGRRLTHELQAGGSRAARLRVVDAVASWLVQMGRETAAPPDTLMPERRRLAEEVLPRWTSWGIPTDLVERLPPLPGVLQHNDPGSWNIVHGPRGFTAVDWESARRYGLPLWDLLYFLTDALLHLDGAWEPDRRDGHNLRLFRGELASSNVLFAWVRRAVEAFSIPPAAVGPLATLCWLHHGVSHLARGDAVARHAPEFSAHELSDAERIARLWLSDESLGLNWRSWL
jgi:hypothetical protein